MKTLKWNLVLAGACFFSATVLTLAQGPTPLLTQPEAKHIATLKSEAEHKAKADACRELAVIGTKEAVPALVALLPDEKLSHMARYALETMPDASAGEALRGQLRVLKGRLLAGVIGSLGVRRDTEAVKPLIGLLSESDPVVAQAAARALGSIATVEAGVALLDAVTTVPEENQLAFCEGLARCAETFTRQGKTEQALAIYGDAYNNTELPHQIRAAALRGAIVSRGKEGLPLLREQLKSTDYILFAAAVRVALEVSGPEATQALAGSLSGLAPDNQVVILQALAHRGDAAALPALLPAVESANPAVRLAAVRAMAGIGNAEAVPVLVKLAGGTDQELSQTAKESLASLQDKSSDTAAVKLLASQNAEERLTGVELIGRRRMTASVPTLLKATADSDQRVRAAAMKQVGELGGAAEIPAMLDLLLSAKNGQDRDAAEQALTGLCANSSDVEAASAKVAAALPQAQPAARSALLSVLASIGGPGALKAVSATAKDGNSEVRSGAIRALSSWKTADAAVALQDLAKNASSDTDKTLALRGFLGLAANPDLPAQQRLSMCQNAGDLVKRPEEKRMLLAALGTVPSPESLKLIVPYLDEPATKEEASAAVVAVAERLLRGQDANPAAAAALVEPLAKVTQVSANADLKRRATDLGQRAKTRSNR